MTRKITLALLGLFMLFVVSIMVAYAAGVRINLTASFPQGLYFLENKPAKRGDLVEFATPDTEVFRQAVERDYISESFLFGRTHLLKRLVAVEGDVVTIDAKGVTVNGKLLSNSKPQTADELGRPLPRVELTSYQLQVNEILLMSEYSPASFDARYFDIQSIEGISGIIWSREL